MMTIKEQEEKVFEEFQTIKEVTEILLDRKIDKTNFKQAICDLTKKTASSPESVAKLDAEDQTNIETFFKNTQYLLGQVIWTEFNNEKNFKITVSYGSKAMTVWTLPIDMFFEKSETYSQCVSLLIKSFTDCLSAYFLNPAMRQMVIEGDEDAVKALYSSFSRPSMDSSYINLRLLKENFPDFYKHITEKLDIMTVEQMDAFIESKKKHDKPTVIVKKKTSKKNAGTANKKK